MSNFIPSTESITIANKTLRSNGSSVFDKEGNIRSIVAQFVFKHFNTDDRICDYGAGKNAIQTMWLRANGFQHVDPHDFGANKPVDERFGRNYDVIFASNVINVADSAEMIEWDFRDMKSHARNGATIVWNYPDTPRKANLNFVDVVLIACHIFGAKNVNIFDPKKNLVICHVEHNYSVHKVTCLNGYWDGEADTEIWYCVDSDGEPYLETTDEEVAYEILGWDWRKTEN